MDIFDEGATDILTQALEILVATEHLLVVNNPEGGPTLDKDAVRQYGFALCGEVHELCDELGWKDWKLPREPDYERSKDEFADVLAFLGVMVQLTNKLAGTSCAALAQQFRVKSQVNIDRINLGKVEGYGGPLVRGANARGRLEVGYYYHLQYHGRSATGLLEGVSDDGIFAFALTAPDPSGLTRWYLAVDDTGWIARGVTDAVTR
jgi:NTP pyrophosphatase (non-canonical NTP hydrolase)